MAGTHVCMMQGCNNPLPGTYPFDTTQAVCNSCMERMQRKLDALFPKREADGAVTETGGMSPDPQGYQPEQ